MVVLRLAPLRVLLERISVATKARLRPLLLPLRVRHPLPPMLLRVVGCSPALEAW